MATSLSSSTIFDANPYEGHPQLTELEAEVLWQYAKLAQNVKEVRFSYCWFRGVRVLTSVSRSLRRHAG